MARPLTRKHLYRRATERLALLLLRTSIVVLAVGLAGCASLPANPAEMTAEQLREWVKDKNANIGCGVINSPYGRGVMVYVVLDRGIVVNGTVVVDDQCKVTITNTAPAKP